MDEAGNEAASILTEADGYFTYLGLKPGSYIAKIDPVQLEKLGYTSNPEEIFFEIEVDEYGDIEDTMEFVVISLQTVILVVRAGKRKEEREERGKLARHRKLSGVERVSKAVLVSSRQFC